MNFGILVCTHQGHRRFLKPVLESLKKTNPKIILVAYDYPFNQDPPFPLEKSLPDSDVMRLADMWFFNEFIFPPGAGVGPGWIKQQFYGTELIKMAGIKYLISINGDCIFTNPNGVNLIFDMLTKVDGDILSSHYTDSGFFGTMCYFAKTDVAVKITCYVLNHCIITSGITSESWFGKAIVDENFKWVPVENQESVHFSYGKKGTFFNVLGLRHLHGTEKWRKGNHHKPLPEYFYDKRYLPSIELDALRYFWETGKTDKLIKSGYWNKKPIDEKVAIRFFDEI